MFRQQKQQRTDFKITGIITALVVISVLAGCAGAGSRTDSTALSQETESEQVSESDVLSEAASRNEELFESVCPGSGHIGIVLANEFGFDDIDSVEMCNCTDKQEQKYDVIVRLTDGKSYHIQTTHGNVMRIDDI